MPAYLQGLQKVRKRYSGCAFASVCRNRPEQAALPMSFDCEARKRKSRVQFERGSRSVCVAASDDMRRASVARVSGAGTGCVSPDDKMSECQKQKPRECDIPSRVRTRAEIRDSRAVARWHFVNGNGLSLYSARGKGTCRACASFPRKRFRGFPDIPLSGFQRR